MTPSDFLARAERDLRSAHLLLNDSDANGAANRTYYAMFHAASAALASRGLAFKTHAGVIGQFAQIFVRDGSIEMALGRAFKDAESLRYSADYRDDGVDAEDVREMLALAEMFVRRVSACLAADLNE